MDTEASDFFKVISVLKSCKTMIQFIGAENMYDNFKRLHFGSSLYEYHQYDVLWDDVWYDVLENLEYSELETIE